MKRVVLFLAATVTALALGCDTQQPVAPQSTVLLKKIATDASISCLDVAAANHKGNKNAPVALRCAIQAPGPTPLTQGQKGWIDGHNYYLADQSNKGLDVFDADALTFLGRVDGMAGPLAAGGGTATTNGPGPSSVVLSDHRTAWVSDGNSTTWIVDVKAMQIIGSVNTSIRACDRGPGATGHYCGRANEIGYDPEHQLVFVQNPTALDTAAPHNQIDTYATFISARPPYAIVGTISFPDRRGQESPVWDQKTHRILTAVSGRAVITGTDTAVFQQYVAVINPSVRPFTVEKKYDLNCQVLVPGSPKTLFGINDPTLGADQHMIIPGCGRPIILNAATGAIISSSISQVPGGNETSYGTGDGNFYVDAALAGGTANLGVIDARSAQLLQIVPNVGGANPAAYGKKNRVFTIVAASATATACTAFGYQTSGCITVFGHEGKDDADEPDADDDD